MKIFDGKTVLITGGTGSLGKILTKRLLNCENGKPKKIIIFSRDEAKQHFMRLEYQCKTKSTDEIIYNNFKQLLEFRIGDIRDYHTVLSALRGVDIVINAAALKQVPACEYFPYEAVKTNIMGAENLVKAIMENNLGVDTVVGVSTDKACKPVNVMGMTKSIQERIFIGANILCPNTRFICVRYGNVLASRGSVIPLFFEQIKSGGPVTLTTKEMTRFLLSLDEAVNLIFNAIENARAGETFIPKVSSSLIYNIAKALIGQRKIKIEITGIRPGEKIHEILISEEEGHRSFDKGKYFIIKPMLPEIFNDGDFKEPINKEYGSSEDVLGYEDTVKFLKLHDLLSSENFIEDGEFLK
ncbi:MAG: polysaccharide biosynthesis protein [Actinomycetota bacterium]|nr:polysaccharide biosynthesis protein [Actinomycetota bacterium]